MWRAARLLSALPLQARTASGASAETWAIREVWQSVSGEQHPQIKAELDRQAKATLARQKEHFQRAKARRAAELAAQRAE